MQRQEFSQECPLWLPRCRWQVDGRRTLSVKLCNLAFPILIFQALKQFMAAVPGLVYPAAPSPLHSLTANTLAPFAVRAPVLPTYWPYLLTVLHVQASPGPAQPKT